ncbi:MAG: type IV pilin protein [Gammaproteobacteria bacterium]|nr:type IV pilin protein [Gammaproteobacteria bacterium]
MNRVKQTNGFTLIELMIAVVVVSIISAIAYPSYVDTVRKSRRSDGESALLEAAQRLEVFYASQATYTDDLTDPDPEISDTSPEGYYTISISGATGACPITSCYELNAVPTDQNGQDNDRVQGFRILSTGARTHTLDGSAYIDGWSAN